MLIAIGTALRCVTDAKPWALVLANIAQILNAIAGSMLLALGATGLALLMGVPMVLYLHSYGQQGPLGGRVRLALDVMWGIPSIVYGAFGFALMVMVGLRASLLVIAGLSFLFIKMGRR